MSGGVGPCSDIRLPQEESTHKDQNDPIFPAKSPSKSTPTRRGLFNFRQLNALAVAVVVSSSGMVSPQDFVFSAFSLVYISLLARFSFPPLSPPPNTHHPRSKLFTLCISLGAVIGIFLPIVYIFEGIFEGDKEGIKAAAPHVFLLASQFFVEGVSVSAGFSAPIRVFVSIMYNTVRIFAIMDWVKAEVAKAEEVHSGSEMRLYVGRGLAVANLVFWCCNLFGFLLPIYLPRALKSYYLVKEGKIC